MVMAAGLACGAAPESLRETVRHFRPVEHRLEEVAEIKGVRFFNDSKATSVDATMKALEAFANDAGKIVLILGGRGKRAPYAPLVPLVRERVRRMVLIGEDAPVIEKELNGAAPFERAADMSVTEVCTDWRQLLRDNMVDAVDLALPHKLHRDAIVDAAESGKHILTEKPLWRNRSEAKS